MESLKNTLSGQDQEITFKSLMLKATMFRKYLLRKWYVIVICGLLGAGLGLTISWVQPTKYSAELTFVLEDSKSSGMGLGSYAGLASQFGIDLGGGSSGIFSGDNILAFLKSRLMVEKALLSPIVRDDKAISMADYYIEFKGLRDKWKKIPEINQLSYPLNQDRQTFSIQQDSVLQKIYAEIIKENLVVSKPDKKLSFISVKCLIENERFSKSFVEKLVKEATDFYIITKTQRSTMSVNKLQAKADSIEQLLNKKTYSVAASQDMNLNPARSIASVNTEVAMRDKVVLQTMYAEVVKNLEISRMSMAQETPIIQIVDVPRYPLKKEKLGKLKGLILGGVVAGVLSILFLLIRRIYKDLMA